MLKLNAVQAPSALIHDIEARLARGDEVSQADWDLLAGAFNDDDIEELVPPDVPPPKPKGRPSLACLIRDVFEEQHKK